MRWLLTTISALAFGMVLGRSTRQTAPPVPPRSPVPPHDGYEPAVPSSAREQDKGAARPTLNPWKVVFGAVLIVFGVIAAIYFSYQLKDVITLWLVALLLAVGLQGPVASLHRLGLPRPIGLLAIYVGVMGGLVLAGLLLLPPVYRDLRALANQAPAYFDEAERQFERLGVSSEVLDMQEVRQRALSAVTNDVGNYAGRALSIFGFILSVFGGLFNLFFLLVLSIFVVMEGPALRKHLLSLMSADNQRLWEDLTQKMAVKIQGWMRGTLLLGLIIGTITTVSLLVIGMPYPFLFGLIAGIGELIPMIGPIIAAVPAVAIAPFYGLGMFGIVLGLYIVIQQLENYLIVPRIMGSSVDLPGLVVLVAFLIGTELMGVTGGILAMPVAAIVQVLWLDWIVPSIRRGRAARMPIDVQVGIQSAAATRASAETPPVPVTAR